MSKKNKFIILVGDYGAVATQFSGNKLIKRIFLDSPNSPDINMFFKDKPYPIYLLVDIADQFFDSNEFHVSVSGYKLKKLLENKIRKNYTKDDIVEAMPLKKSPSGESRFVFVSMKNHPPLSDWVDFLSSLSNPFAGFYSLPVEGVSLLESVAKSFSKKSAKWKMLVSHNKVSGFRQVIVKDGEFFLSRISNPVGGINPGVVAGNIEQEIQNTLEYLRRVGYKEGDSVDVFVIASQEVKEKMDASSVNSVASCYSLTPELVAKSLGYKNVAKSSDKFGDISFSMVFSSQKKPALKFFNQKTAMVNKYIKLLGLVKTALALVVVVTVCYIGYSFYDKRNLVQEIGDLRVKEKEKLEEQKRIDTLIDSVGGDINLIKETVASYSMMRERRSFLLDIFKKISQFRDYKFLLDNVEYSINSSNLPEINAEMELFIPSDYEFADALDYIDRFSKNFETFFTDYGVTLTGFPNSNSEIVDVSRKGLGESLIFNITISLKN